ncbi:hypothetical protein [Enterococcus sp. S86.2]|uniref:hypothetical protein n=1 Tax=Enterococcus sp. S86.2 TaxID=3031299 RepID=UPI0026EC7C09|nr:hypothetical protein [Enterococcus sp. S86.2]
MKTVLFTLACSLMIGPGVLVNNGEEEIQTNQAIEGTALYSYRFPSIPPKKFAGKTLLYYEYISSGKYYIGWYS